MAALSSRVSLSDRPRWLAIAVLCAAAAAIAGGLVFSQDPASPWRWLHWACKPLTTALIFLLAWRALPVLSARYRRWILAGIACSLFGDVFLMLPQDLFVPGLLAFLLGHLCFLAAFLGDSRFAARPWVLLASFGYGALNLWLLWDSIATALRLPVIVYVIVLTSMGGQAAARAWTFARRGHPHTRSAMLAAGGALVFMLSDSLLAWNRFHGGIPLATLWVLATYYLALWWIARSVQRDDSMIEAGAVQ